MDSLSSAVKDRKQVQNASNKISCVVHRVLLPLLSADIPSFVSFRAVGAPCSSVHGLNIVARPNFGSSLFKTQVDSVDRTRDLLEHLRAAEPSSVKDRASFVQRMGSLYDASFTPASTTENAASSNGEPYETA